ncbi:MAG: hypothetical protein EOO73_22750 [Myxococcales bacterium]|nr:MAG: hypothetical protein EOO73_22750 [Myxococcales bacterium]
MANRLSYVVLFAAFTGSLLVGACGDDDAIPGGGEAGETGSSGSPGEAGSGGSGVSGSGGSSVSGSGGSGVSGSSVGGQVAAGGQGGEGGAGDGGLGGVGGSDDTGQAGAVSEGGAGGSADPGVVYACGQTTIVHKFCSAAASLNCADQAECPDCVSGLTDERQNFAECAPCLAEYDKVLDCAITPFEQGNPSGGLECVEDYGADFNETCYNQFLSALSCANYPATHDDMCPPKWPLDG